MEKLHLFVRAFALLLSIVTGFFGGLIPHRADRFYTEEEIERFTAVSEAAYPDGMIIAIGGKFDSDDTFRPILERSLAHVNKEHPHMLFVPTASYDEYAENDGIITRFAAAGCATDVLLVSKETAQAAAEKFAWADIVYATGGSLYTYYALSQDMADKLRDLIDTTTKAALTDTSVRDIVLEQAAPYFTGQKSVEETAQLVQSKVNIYVNEQR